MNPPPPPKRVTTPSKGVLKAKKEKSRIEKPEVVVCVEPTTSPISIPSFPPTPSTSTSTITTCNIKETSIPSTSASSPEQIPSSPPDEEPDEMFEEDKSYAGFSAESIKVIWDQFNDTDMTLTDEVYFAMAEDVSYKIWELISIIKTYSKHSGGNVTSDLVNEVLKDMDCPPILGAATCDWDEIDYDGTVYFNLDDIIDLRHEYLKDENLRELTDIEYSSNWLFHSQNDDFLIDFIYNLINAIIKGDEESFQYALDTAGSVAQIGPALHNILPYCIEYLAFEQTSKMRERFLKLLLHISFNPYSRDVGLRSLFYHLSEVLVSLLIGPLSTYKIVPRNDSATENIDHMDVTDNNQANPQSQCENNPNIETINAETDSGTIPESFPDSAIEDNDSEKIFKLLKTDEPVADKIESCSYSPYSAKMMRNKEVDLIVRTIGSMGAQFGYFQNEMVCLIRRRIEAMFQNRRHFHRRDYERLGRAIRGMIALGEYAFRELIPFFTKLDPSRVPETLWNDFALAAVFLNGRKDIFLYEYLEDMCGDRLQPFMLHSQRYHEQLLLKNLIIYIPNLENIQRLTKVKITPVDKIKYKRRTNQNDSHSFTLSEYFPEYKLAKIHNIIKIQFVGCREVPVKQKANPNPNFFKPSPPRKIYSYTGSLFTAKRITYKPINFAQSFPLVPNPCFIHL